MEAFFRLFNSQIAIVVLSGSAPLRAATMISFLVMFGEYAALCICRNFFMF